MSKTIAAKFVSTLQGIPFTVEIGHDGRNRYHVPHAEVLHIASTFGGITPIDSGNCIEFDDGSIALRDFDDHRNEVNWVIGS